MTSEAFHLFCRDQIGRLGSYAKFPDLNNENTRAIAKAAIKELIDTLEFRVSRGDPEFAKRVIDAFRESGSHYCPSPADLIAIGSDLREQERTGPKQGFPGCEACSFSGWVYVEDGGQGSAKACGCRKAMR